MDFPKHISDLLTLTERVVVPGFGVFSLKYIPAKIHTAKQTFEPPAKELLFTSAIKDDTGSLIRHIAEKEGIKEKEAQRKLEKFVKDCNDSLADGKELSFERIGNISRKPDGTYMFRPDKSFNYFNETFGMESFNAPKPVVEEKPKKIVVKDKTIKTARQKQIRKLVLTLSLLIPLAAIVILGIFNYNLIKSKISEYYPESEIAEQKDELPVKEEMQEGFSDEKMLVDTVSGADTISNEAISNDVAEPMESEETNQEIIDEGLKAPDPGKKFYIVAGSFSLEKNAEKLVKKLRSKGYNSEIFGNTRHGLMMVSYESYVLKNEALTELKRIINQENPNAWLIEY